MRHCQSAQAATWGRWVTHSTWRSRPRRASSLPTISATRPPIPTSTSSKISVGTALSRLVMTWIASPMRDSSPPEATLARLRSGWPAFAATRNSTASTPEAEGLQGSSATSKRPPAIARSCIAAAISSESRRAAGMRAAVSFAAAAS